MRLLITGRGTSGSWAIRAEQLGRAMGATVVADARDVAAYDAVIIVKRASEELVQRIHRAHVPLIYDVVDAWPQPDGNAWSRDESMSWLRQKLKAIRPMAVVAATRWMARDLAEFGLPTLCVPHHARPGLVPTDIRPMRVVGYEGSHRHLGTWQQWLEWECAGRGWQFVMNPPQGYEVDVLIALRELDGYPARHWKSNVKLANAQALGTPIICNREAGYIETACGAEFFADTREEVQWSLSALESPDVRRALAPRMREAAPMLVDVAARYEAWLADVCTTAPSY